MNKGRAGIRCKSAKYRRSQHGNRLNIVNLNIDDAPTVNTSMPTKFEIYVRQHDHNQHVQAGVIDERLLDDEGVNEDCDANSVRQQFAVHSDDQIIINTSKSARNVRQQALLDNDGVRPLPPYRPISSHQYLTSTELRDTAAQDGNGHLGRPTRTTLLRERQRRTSVPSLSTGSDTAQKNGQKQEQRVPTRYETVTNILYAMIPPGQSLHSFLSGARYNKNNWIENLGGLGLASDLPDLSAFPSNLSKIRPVSDSLEDESLPKAPPDSPADVSRDVSSTAFFPVLNREQRPSKDEPEIHTLKVAWDDTKLSSVPSDKASTRDDKARGRHWDADTDEVARDRGHHVARPSSVKLFSVPPVKPDKEIESVMIQGISIHGNTFQTSRDYSNYHPQSERLSGTRRSWSALSYHVPSSRISEGLSKLNPLKVTGVKVSGVADNARPGPKLSSVRSNKIENDSDIAEMLVRSRRGQFDHQLDPRLESDRKKDSFHLETTDRTTPEASLRELEDLGSLDRGLEIEGKVTVPLVKSSTSERVDEDGDGLTLDHIAEFDQRLKTSELERDIEPDMIDRSIEEEEKPADDSVIKEKDKDEQGENDVLFFLTEEGLIEAEKNFDEDRDDKSNSGEDTGEESDDSIVLNATKDDVAARNSDEEEE